MMTSWMINVWRAHPCLLNQTKSRLYSHYFDYRGKKYNKLFPQKVSRADNIAKSMASEGNRALLSVNVDHAVNSSLEFRCSTLSFSVNKINCYLGTLNIALY